MEGESASASGVLTIVFTDVEGSTALATAHGDDVAERLIDLQRRVIRDQVEAHGGKVADSIGDGFMLVFGSTRRAVTCAVEIQRALAQHAREQPDENVRVRIGLNVGEVLERDGHPFGAAVNGAARVMAKAAGGEILASDPVRQLAGTMPGIAFRERGRFQLKGFDEPWRLYEVTGGAAPPRRARRSARRLSLTRAAAVAVPVILAGSVAAAVLARRVGEEGAQTTRSGRPLQARTIDDSAEILPGRSIGDARLGMSERDVVSMYGEPELVRDWTAPGKVGSILNFTLHHRLFRVYLFDGRVVGLTTQSDYYETDDGLRVGGRIPLPEDADAGVTRSAARDFIWRDRYVYRDIGGGCNFWALRGFGAVTEFIMPRHGVRRVAGVRIADETLVDEIPREIGLCR